MAYTSGWKGQFKALPCVSTSRLALTICHSDYCALTRLNALLVQSCPMAKRKSNGVCQMSLKVCLTVSLATLSDQAGLSKDAGFQKDVGDASPACHHRTTPSMARGTAQMKVSKTSQLLPLLKNKRTGKQILRPLCYRSPPP